MIRLIVTAFVSFAGGFFVCGIFSVGAYQKGYEDGYREGQNND